MSVSVQELDNTVRAFYEGKGDVVGLFFPQTPLCLVGRGSYRIGDWEKTTDLAQQKQAQQTLTEVSSRRSFEFMPRDIAH